MKREYYTLIRLRPDGFIEHEHTEARLTAEGKIHHAGDGELYAFAQPENVAKLKAIMINRAIGDAVLQIKWAEERIEKLQGMRESVA